MNNPIIYFRLARLALAARPSLAYPCAKQDLKKGQRFLHFSILSESI